MEQKILKDIEETGFVIELKALSEFIDRKWDVSGNQIYEDLDSGKSREIDIIAEKSIGSSERHFNFIIRINLIIEIKKASHPWVIFTTKNKESMNDHLGWEIIHWGANNEESKMKFKEDIYINLPILSSSFLKEEKYFNLERRFGRTFYEACKKSQHESKIYTALLSACKATWHEFMKYNHSNKLKKKVFDEKLPVNLDILIPVVIVEGKLFEFYLGKNLEKVLNEVDYVPIHFKYSSSKYKSLSGFDIDFYPIILKYDYLDVFIEDVENWLNSLKQRAIQELTSRKSTSKK